MHISNLRSLFFFFFNVRCLYKSDPSILEEYAFMNSKQISSAYTNLSVLLLHTLTFLQFYAINELDDKSVLPQLIRRLFS